MKVTTEYSAGVIIFITSPLRTLLIRNSKGHWDFPKGHIKVNENKIAAALRETKEETGLDVKIFDGFETSFAYTFKQKDSLIHKTVFFFIGQSSTDEVKLSFEHNEYKWLLFQDAIQTLNYKQQKDLLTKAYNYITQNILQ